MDPGLPLYEAEINTMLREYLTFSGFEKTSYALQLECKEKGKTLPGGKACPDDGTKLAIQNSILLEYDAGQYVTFWKLWQDHVPPDIRKKDYTCQRLEFYIQIHFAVYPIRVTSLGGEDTREEAMARFKNYLENSGSSLSQTTEFLPFYALPFVPNPIDHPSFKDLFTPNWIPELRVRVERFLSAALSAAEPPVIIKLVKNKDRLLLDEDASAQANAQLQQQLVQAERRCGVYMRRFNKLQSDYHTLISITAELVDSLEQTVHGKMVTVEYLQSVCARLFNSRAVGASTAHFNDMDFTRPGTASSLLWASIAQENLLQDQNDLLPSLDYNKIKGDLTEGSDRVKALILQALRWRLTRSVSGEQRETVLDAFIANDLFGCWAGIKGNYTLVNMLKSTDASVRQYAARLYNAVTSLRKGRTYLCGHPDVVHHLLAVLLTLHDGTDRICKEHLLGCLQKLSLRRSLQTIMIEGGLLRWLVMTLSEYENLSDYMLEYAIALLMNLCLRSSGKKKCGDMAEDVLKVLSNLLAHENAEIRPYVNGALYSVLSNQNVKYVARGMELEGVLRDLMDGEQPEFKRQLGFIIRQLNADSEEAQDGEESDDENDEDDDDEDQDAMEADLDKDEVLKLRPGELSGEKLLCAEYLGIMTHSHLQPLKPPNPLVQSLTYESGIPHRPLTPGRKKVDSSQVHGEDTTDFSVGESVKLSGSYPSTLVAASQSKDFRPPTSAGSRPTSHGGQSPRSVTGKKSGVASGSRPATGSSERSGISRSIRHNPHDKESSELIAQKTGLVRSLVPPVDHRLPEPSGKALEATGTQGMKEYATVFSSRPRILRTPDVGPKGAPPPNPKFSRTEPHSRPTSSSSWRGSKESSGSSNPQSSVRTSQRKKP